MEDRANWDLYLSITPRRAAILALVNQQRTQPEIARRLDISVHTVRSHVDWLRIHTTTSSMAALGRWWGRHRGGWLCMLEHIAGTGVLPSA